MSHFAKVENGIVTKVIVAEQEVIDSEIFGTGWVQTSYNTFKGVHYDSITNLPDEKPALRYNYARIGSIYDKINDVFYLAQPFPSWVLDKTSWTWKPPIMKPTDGQNYIWDENIKDWIVLLTNIEPLTPTI